MKIGIVLNTNEPETVWNVFRFGNEALNKKHSVKIFLLGRGVEAEGIKDEKFKFIDGAIKKFVNNQGIILACGTCLKIRQKEKSKICPISTMEEMMQLVEESDKVLTFG